MHDDLASLFETLVCLAGKSATIRRADCFHSACICTKLRTPRFALIESCIEMDDLGYPHYTYRQRDGRDICISTADKDPSKQSILTYGSEGLLKRFWPLG